MPSTGPLSRLSCVRSICSSSRAGGSAMSVARHPRPKELEGVPLEEIMKKYVGRFKDKKPDWAAFEDAKTEGYKRAQHRFIGGGGSGQDGGPTVFPAGEFTLSVIYVETRPGKAPPTPPRRKKIFWLRELAPVCVRERRGRSAQ